MTTSIVFKPFGGQKIVIVDRKYPKPFFRIVLPTGARSTILKTCGAKSELEHKNNEKGILKLTFLMQSRIMIQPEQFFCISLGQCGAK